MSAAPAKKVIKRSFGIDQRLVVFFFFVLKKNKKSKTQTKSKSVQILNGLCLRGGGGKSYHILDFFD